jgi:hypothetical protein
VFSYHVMINKTDTEAVYGPTTHPPPFELPNLDFNSTAANHTFSSPTLFQITLVPYSEGASHMPSQILMNSADLSNQPIKMHLRFNEKLPDHDSSTLQTMSTDHKLIVTHAQSGSTIEPLVCNQTLHFDSEVLTYPLTILPFLCGTQSLHPLILSAVEGVYLGTTTNLIGHDHTDFLFLNAGIFDLTSKPYSITPATAFV